MQTKIKIKGKLLIRIGQREINLDENQTGEIELDLSDLHQQHPELWLGEESIKKAIEILGRPVTHYAVGNAVKEYDAKIKEAVDILLKIAKEPKSTEDLEGLVKRLDSDKLSFLLTEVQHELQYKHNIPFTPPKSTEPIKCNCKGGNLNCSDCGGSGVVGYEPKCECEKPHKIYSGTNECICGKPISEPTTKLVLNSSKVVVEPKSAEECKCGICGGKLIEIRGRFPHTVNRKVCPQCCAERLDHINEISSKDYGKCYQVNP